MRLDLLLKSICQRLSGRFQIVPGLEVQPKLRFHAKEAPETERGIGTDSAFSVDNFVNPPGRYARGFGQKELFCRVFITPNRELTHDHAFNSFRGNV